MRPSRWHPFVATILTAFSRMMKGRSMPVRARLGIDAALAAAFLVAYRPTLTGMDLHEWLAVALAAICLFHLALNWDWAVHTAKSHRRSPSISCR